MKPVRRLPNLWPGRLPLEQRLALVASALLFLLIGGMAYYQLRLAPPPAGPDAEPEVVGAPADPTAAGPEAPAAPNLTSPAAADADGAPAETGAAPEATPDLSWPLTGVPVVVKAFGSVDDSLGDYRLYDAVALEATPGQPVVAAAAGTVGAVEEHPVDGMVVVLEHDADRQTRYAGLAEVTVAEGEAVLSGQVLGRAGEPAPLRHNLGPHIAFSLLIEGEPVDPSLHVRP